MRRTDRTHTNLMVAILQATAEFLKSRKFAPAFTEDGEVLLDRFCGDHLFWTTVVDTAQGGAVLTLLSRVPVKVPPSKGDTCANLLARVNYGKRQGAFHLDLRDGEVIFCISNALTAGIVSEETLESLFGTTVSAMNQHAPEIMKLVYDGVHGPKSKSTIPVLNPMPFRNWSYILARAAV